MFSKSTTKSYTKNYLRVYCNIEKELYSDVEKNELIKTLISIPKGLFINPKLAFDISGSGYGISKGDGTLGIKAFNNRLLKKGMSQLVGVSVEVKGENYHSSFYIMSNIRQSLKRLDIEFNWKHTGEDSLDLSIELIKKISKIVNISYAYCYPDDETLCESGEWRIKTDFLSTISFQPETEELWNSSLEKIKEGAIKKIYPINVFNSNQKELLKSVKKEMKIVKINDTVEVWQIKLEKFNKVMTANNAIIK